MIDIRAHEVLQLAEMYEKGLPPIAGGVLDQSQWFVSAARFCWGQKSEIEAHEWKSKD